MVDRNGRTGSQNFHGIFSYPQIATHTVALCQLIIEGSPKGLHWFIVPLRDPSTGRLLPGISAGDIGAKMGRNSLDNGWIQFNSVRIPRGNMLMKWSRVNPDGSYSPPPNQTVAYASLIGERLLVPAAVFENVAQAATIAIRYGAVRRQGPNEEQLLYYQSHQTTLMPVISGSYAAVFVYR
jgi:acyl-CoA oxidase